MAPQNDDIDLSAGLVSKQAAPAADDGIDLSAGLVPKTVAPSASQQLQDPHAFDQFAPKPTTPLDPPKDHREQLVHSIGGDTALGVYRQARTAVSKVEDLLKPENGFAAARQAVKDLGSSLASNAASAVTPAPYDLNPATHPIQDTPSITPIPGVSMALEAATPAVAQTIPTATSSLRINPFRAAVSKFTGSDIQPALKSGIRDVWNTVADKAGVARPIATSVQDAGEEVADSLLARSKANYGLIDKATDGRFSGTEKSLADVNRALRSVTNDTEEQNLMIRKTRLEMQMDQMMDDARKQGVSKATVDAAKADFKQAQAIYDTNHQIRMSTTGVRPGMKGAAEVPEEVNAKPLMNRLNKLHNSGRLQQAVGDDSAEDLIGHSAIAQKAVKDVARRRLAAEVAVPTIAGAAGTAYSLAKK